MKRVVQFIAQGRKELAELTEMKTYLEKQIAASELGQNLAYTNEEIRMAKEHVTTLEEKCREGALNAYETSGERNIHPALLVKLYIVLDYDPEQAKAWCMDKHPDGLRLDKRAFEKAAKVLQPGFVTVAKEPRVTIARDLSTYLPEPDAP